MLIWKWSAGDDLNLIGFPKKKDLVHLMFTALWSKERKICTEGTCILFHAHENCSFACTGLNCSSNMCFSKEFPPQHVGGDGRLCYLPLKQGIIRVGLSHKSNLLRLWEALALSNSTLLQAATEKKMTLNVLKSSYGKHYVLGLNTQNLSQSVYSSSHCSQSI